MSTFEEAKAKLIKQMSSIKVHTPESYSRIMIDCTKGLVDVKEQHKFWNHIMNPEGVEDVPTCKFCELDPMKPIDTKTQFTMTAMSGDDEKSEDIVIQQTAIRNGMVCSILQKRAATD